jgi:Spy/CpxP family protein refolding chaperone
MTKRAVVSLLTGLVLIAAANFRNATVEAAVSSTDWTQPAREGPSHSRHKWWKDERFKAELGLTVQQVQEVEQIFESTLPRLRLGKQQLDQLEADLSRMIRERTADEGAVALQIERVEAARADLNKTRTLMHYRMYRVLSHEQNAKLRAMNERDRPDRKENHQ